MILLSVAGPLNAHRGLTGEAKEVSKERSRTCAWLEKQVKSDNRSQKYVGLAGIIADERPVG